MQCQIFVLFALKIYEFLDLREVAKKNYGDNQMNNTNLNVIQYFSPTLHIFRFFTFDSVKNQFHG